VRALLHAYREGEVQSVRVRSGTMASPRCSSTILSLATASRTATNIKACETTIGFDRFAACMIRRARRQQVGMQAGFRSVEDHQCRRPR
jgi:hypothetical protein